MFTFIAFFMGGRSLGAFGFQLSFNGLAYKAWTINGDPALCGLDY